LESIRRLTNVMRHDQPAVSAVVVGGAKLDETLTSPALEPFVQRVATRCYLHPLTGEETRQYIRDAIHACDASPDETITEGAVSAIFHASSGVPRLINQLMTESIDCAAERDQSLIDEAIVDQAWANLQQLPGPITDEPVLQAHPGEHSVVEFGELQDPLPAPMLNRTGEQAQKATANSDSLPAPIEDAPELSVETTSTDELTGQTDAASPALQQPPVTTDPETLFGDFDQEEAIAVGAENHRAARPPACDHDLESTIHSQIVSLSHFAAEHTEFRTDAADGLVAGNGRPVATDLPLPTAPIAEEPLELAPEAATPAEPEETFPSVVWYDENQLAEEATELPRDDSDLLWVTEDIDVDRRVGDNTSRVLPHRVDGPDDPESPKLSVDYREMLEKMRNSHG
jgi:hypothetical protein